jgi:GMP synthase-like glutamine amidotransferase
MKVLSVVHEADAAAGVFADAAAERGDELIEWVPPSGEPPPDGFDAALVFGGSMNVDQEQAHPWLPPEKELLRALLRDERPTLGVCLGAQLLAEAAGAEPRRADTPEIGWYEIELTAEASADPVFGPLPERFIGFQWHGFEFPLPPGAVALARSPACLQAFRAGGAAWGVQFHAEVTRESIASWVAQAGEDGDEDARRLEVVPERLLAECDRKIAAWNRLGRDLCGRFLDAAAANRG